MNMPVPEYVDKTNPGLNLTQRTVMRPIGFVTMLTRVWQCLTPCERLIEVYAPEAVMRSGAGYHTRCNACGQEYEVRADEGAIPL